MATRHIAATWRVAALCALFACGFGGGAAGAEALERIARLHDVSDSRKIFEAAGYWADDAAQGTAREACEGVARWANHAEFGAEEITRALEALSPAAAQGYFRAAGKCLDESVPNGVERVRDSLAAMKATPKTGGVDDAVAGMLDATIPTMKDFHAMRNLDPEQLTAAQRIKLREIRETLGTPHAGTPCQRVMRLDDLQNYLNAPPNTKRNISGFFTKLDDVEDLDTVGKIREGLRLDYSGSKFIGENEVAIIEFNMPIGGDVKAPYDNIKYPGTGNGFTGTRMGKVIPEFEFKTAINIPDGAKLFWLDPQGNKVPFGVFINGAWQ